ncbi:MAG: hypothetical protein IAF58_08785 [Leptolyngbya sp.]|nr:hypothetical protein [Candidatus Melainabacteria bacterium]
MNNNTLPLKKIGLTIVAIAASISFLKATTSGLLAYILATSASDVGAANVSFSLLTFLGVFAFGTVVYSFILSIATIIGAVFYGIASGAMLGKKKAEGETAAHKAENPVLHKALKYALYADLIVAGLVSAWTSLGLYIALTAISPLTVLIAITAVLNFILTFAFTAVVFGFIGGIALLMLAIIVALFSGGLKGKADTSGK